MPFPIDMGKIYAEAAAILERLHDLGIFPVSGPGGVMIPLTVTESE
jgi:hypothetical protein